MNAIYSFLPGVNDIYDATLPLKGRTISPRLTLRKVIQRKHRGNVKTLGQVRGTFAQRPISSEKRSVPIRPVWQWNVPNRVARASCKRDRPSSIALHCVRVRLQQSCATRLESRWQRGEYCALISNENVYVKAMHSKQLRYNAFTVSTGQSQHSTGPEVCNYEEVGPNPLQETKIAAWRT